MSATMVALTRAAAKANHLICWRSTGVMVTMMTYVVMPLFSL
jgi:hypothetical protein